MTWQKGKLTEDGLGLAYHRTGGDKPVLVLAHGAMDNGLCWSRVARMLEPDFDIVMVDARGHGESDRATEKYSVADDLARVIDTLSLEKPFVMGHSMGANAAAGLAARYPEMVSRVVLEDPPWSQPPADGQAGNDRRRQFTKWIEHMDEMSVEEITKFGKGFSVGWDDEEFPDWAQSKKQFQREIFGFIGHEDYREIVRQIRCPTLVVHADVARGSMLNESTAKEIAAANPNIRTHHIADAGHNIRREQFGNFVEVVLAFLKA